MRQAKKSQVSELLKIGAVVVLFSIAFTVAFGIGLKRQDKIDCMKWQSWDKDFVLFEPSSQMSAHCSSIGVDLKK
jgi:hypothetical protein